MTGRARIAKVALCAALVALPSGCHRASIVDSRLPEGSAETEWESTFLWGLVGDPEVDARYLCRGATAHVRSGGDPAAAILAVVTLGIYMPRAVRVTCALPAAPSAATTSHPGERRAP
jgi:hypothetical protein